MTPAEYFGSQEHFNRNLQEMAESDKQHVIAMLAEYAKQQSIDFLRWHNSLSDAGRCTVWSPDGSMTGLFNNPKENLYEKFINLPHLQNT